jgi:hypothetical protein
VGVIGLLSNIYLVLLSSGTGYPFSSFPTDFFIEFFFLAEWVPSLLLLLIAPLGAVKLCF